uniref:Induced immature seed protein n=1 Tax=Fagopyrum esculentum TaxID=3617 RepID=O23879_FAGES|nr:induced immature seed protein [Fagopyrum esculentum]
MADRRNQGSRQVGNPTGGVGAPGTTGAFQTSDPLGAPGSTGAGLTHQDPTAIPRTGGAVYEDPDMEFGSGGQQQQLRDPTSGIGFEDTDEYGRTWASSGQKGDTGFTTAGAGKGYTGDSGVRSKVGSGQTTEHGYNTSGVGSGDMGDFGRRRAEPGLTGDTEFDSAGFKTGETGDFDQSRADQGPVGVTGFTRITTATAPGGGVMYGRETVAKAEEMGTTTGSGKREDKGVVEKTKEKAKELKDRVQGGHNR